MAVLVSTFAITNVLLDTMTDHFLDGCSVDNSTQVRRAVSRP
jgi:hypothetical protein